MTKTEYMGCKFSNSRYKDLGVIILDGQKIPKSEVFRYLGSIIHNDIEILKRVWIIG